MITGDNLDHFFSFLHQNIFNGHSLMLPWWGNSNEYNIYTRYELIQMSTHKVSFSAKTTKKYHLSTTYISSKLAIFDADTFYTQ